jgi:hypothetical protein
LLFIIAKCLCGNFSNLKGKEASIGKIITKKSHQLIDRIGAAQPEEAYMFGIKWKKYLIMLIST